MQYYYRLNGDKGWLGPYAEGRICLFDAAWAAQLGGASAEAVGVPNGFTPTMAVAEQRAISARVPQGMLVGDVAHPIYEPPSEWIMVDDEVNVSDVSLIDTPLRRNNPIAPTRPPLAKSITVRNATLDDVDAMLEIQRRAFSPYLTTYTPHQLQSLHETVEDLRRALNGITAYVAVEGNTVRGSVRVVVRNGVAMVLLISVDPEQRGRGIGTTLLAAVEERVRGEAHKLYLEVPLLAPQSQHFFITEGYEPAGVLRRHYGGVDWIAFEKFVG